jgi:mono/diheme cytochrome c family protein
MADRRKQAVGVLAGCAFAGAAWAFPWDIDMVDAAFYRAYEWAMLPLPEGVVSQNRSLTNLKRTDPEGAALTNPLDVSNADVQANGKRMFEVYCVTCHGADGKGGAPVTQNDPAAGKRRYPIPPPNLSGPGAISAVRSDGYMYLTMRGGSAIMPSYAGQMNSDEMWSVVAYIRTLDGAAPSAPQ